MCAVDIKNRSLATLPVGNTYTVARNSTKQARWTYSFTAPLGMLVNKQDTPIEAWHSRVCSHIDRESPLH